MEHQSAIRERRAFIEDALGARLATLGELSHQTCEVVGTVITGHTAAAMGRTAFAQWDVVAEDFAYGDLVLRLRDGRLVAMLLPPDVAMNLGKRRFLRLDGAWSRAVLDEKTFLGEEEAVPLNDGTPLLRRRRLIEETIGARLLAADAVQAFPSREGPIHAEYVRTVDPGALSRRRPSPWTIVRNGRELADVVLRWRGRTFAMLVDPEEADAMHWLRYGGRTTLFEPHRGRWLIAGNWRDAP